MRKMKLFLQIAIIAIFAASNPAFSKALQSLKSPHVTRNNNVMILEYDFEEPDIITKGDIDFVTINGFEKYSKAGAPVIPVKPVEILVPPGMQITEITSIAMNTDQLPGTYRLSHGKKPFRRSEGKPKTPSKPDPEIFEMTKFWPRKHHDLVTVQTNRGYNIAHVNLFPLQYSPKAGRIRMATKLRLKIRFAGMDSHHRVKPTKNLKTKLEQRIENPDTMESYDTYSVEYPLISATVAVASTPLNDPDGPYYGANYKYIVLTSAFLADENNIPDTSYSFQALCASKTARGITAGIVTTDWIYANYDGTKPAGGTDNATKLRNFLIDAYQTWGTEYALLGGDKDIIPIRLLYDTGYGVPADLYYGCVDPCDCTFDNDGDGEYGESNDGPDGGEVDLTAEIFTGRAAVETGSEVVNFVRKTLVYQTIDDDDAYLNQAGTMGSWLGFGGIQEFTKPFAELIRLGSTLYLGHHTHGFEDAGIPNARNFSVRTLYDEDWWNDNETPYYDSSTAKPGDGVDWDWNSMGWSATDDLLPFLNGENGNTTPHLLYISDHGSPEWGMVKLKTTPTTYYNCDDLSKLHNTKPFFFYDDSCKVGAFDYTDCFGEVITTMEHGAFATILNSRDGLGAAGNTLDSPSTQMTREFFHSVLGKGIFELGRAHQDAKESCIWRLGSIAWLRYVYYELNLFGDPELQLRVTTDSNPLIFDLNGDLYVNFKDFSILAQYWGQDQSPFFDHRVDYNDLALFTDYWLKGKPPGQAGNPHPANDTEEVDVNVDLSWVAGIGATSHDVYFGTSSPGTFQSNQADTIFDPGTLVHSNTYYWRIDAVNAWGKTTGTVWSFTTIYSDLQANNPNPSNGAIGVSATADLSWTAGVGATSHDVYFGTSNPPPFLLNQTTTIFDPGTMAYSTKYYWRIDEVGAYGTITGTAWSFTTGLQPP